MAVYVVIEVGGHIPGREDGQCRDYFRALALCRKPKEADTFPSLTPEQRALIENIWFDKQFAPGFG